MPLGFEADAVCVYALCKKNEAGELYDCHNVWVHPPTAWKVIFMKTLCMQKCIAGLMVEAYILKPASNIALIWVYGPEGTIVGAVGWAVKGLIGVSWVDWTRKCWDCLREQRKAMGVSDQEFDDILQSRKDPIPDPRYYELLLKCPYCENVNLDMGVELGGIVLRCSQCFSEECNNLGGGDGYEGSSGAWRVWKEIYPSPWIKVPCDPAYGPPPPPYESRKPLEDLLSPSPVLAAEDSQSMCVKVKIDIPNETTLERQGFEAQLKLGNLRTDYDMTVYVDLDIRDAEGNQANDLFFASTTMLEGIQSLDGGVIPVGQTASIRWLLVPTPGAGGTETAGIKYTVKANINYTFLDKTFELATWPDEITVLPMPMLTLDYFLPAKVYGDDLMTQGIIEEPVPFMWGVRVANNGYGPARNLTINSAQPTIIEATQGVAIDFRLLGTWVNGTVSNNTLNINFGDIQPGQFATAGWQMMCSATGEFSEYTAEFTHSNALGGKATSLIQDVQTHVLVKEFMNDLPGQDQMFDFLVDSDDDAVPDQIFDSSGADTTIMQVAAVAGGSPTPGEPVVTIVPEESTAGEWVYMAIDDPFMNKGQLVSVTRADGKVFNSHNYWLREGKLHLVDYGTGASYAVLYEYIDNVPPATQIQVTPSTNENGWHNSDITINLTAEDDEDGSGIKEIHYTLSGATEEEQTVPVDTVSLTISNEGTTTLTYYSVDNTNNQEEEKSATLKLDKTPPMITASASPEPNSYGWNNTDVTVTFDASDELSGVESVTKPVIVTTEGAEQNVNGEATDLAGNTATASVMVSIDKTPPTITASISPEPNANGWNNTDVTVTFDASDELSGVESVTKPVTVTTEGAEQEVVGEAIDYAGNTATVSVGVNIDKTPPAVSVAADPSTLWPPNHKMVDITISGSATDTISGIALTTFVVIDEYTTTAPILSDFNTTIQLEAWRNGGDEDGRIYTISVTAKDKANNEATSSATVTCPHDKGKGK